MALLSVMVPATFIEDGEALPVLGQATEFALDFFELDSAVSRSAHVQLELLGAMRLEVVAEPRLDLRRGGPLVHEVAGRTRWPTLLRGDGWAAGWNAPQPVAGRSTLEGTLWVTWDVVASRDTRTRGYVRHVQVVSHTVEPTPPGAPPGAPQERRIPGTLRLREVTGSPRFFTRGAREYRQAPPTWLGEDGVLVDLEVNVLP